MVSNKVDINNTYWALKNKFKLEVGVENTIDSRYPDIIWFKQGLYVFTSLNMNVQSNNFTISLNGKDKMCLLNGEVGGSINASTDFGKLEEYDTLDNGEIVRNIVDIPIVDIIKNAVHVYAGEPLHNIVLNDIDNYGLELLEYRGETNLYMPRKISTGDVSNFIINKKQKYYLKNGDMVYVDNEENKEAGNKELIYYDRTGLNEHSATKVWTTPGTHSSSDPDAYNIIKIEFGETAGYRRTDLTYPGDLIANVGESLVSVLDKIKNMFGDFEYFYDIDGKFIFQKKKTYVNTSFNNLETSGKDIYAEDAAYTSSYTYSFEEGTLLTAFTNAPQILNIKNDFSIWGKRKGAGGADLPVHMRYAIDFKPTYYRPIRFKYKRVSLDKDSYQPNKYYTYIKAIDKYVLSTNTSYDNSKTYYEETDEQILNITPFTTNDYDWREIIYQMALDYFKYNHKKDNFTQLVAAANPNYYPTGITGYETYYTDMQGFWRQLYHPGSLDKNEDDELYELFTRQELYDAAREIILQERAFIEEEDISQLIIDYVYDNFNTIRNNFIESIEYSVGNVDPARDISLLIERCIKYGFTENTKVIQGLLADRWIKMGEKDNYDYETMMANEFQKNRKSDLYKTYQILNNYKAQKEFLNKYSDIDLSLMIRDKIAQGYSEESGTIQSLLSTRWKKMMLTYGEDPFDYLAFMEEEYIKNGDSPMYQAYLIMYDYKNIQKEEYVDETKMIMKETDKGKVELDAYLSFLYNARQRKINNYGYDSLVVSNDRLIWIISTLIKTFEKTKKDFKEEIKEMINQQLDKNAYDFSQELIDYIVEHYENRQEFFYINNKLNKISVENAHIQYLLDMRQEKIEEVGDDLFYIDNNILVITMLELFETTKAEDFKEQIEKKLASVYDIIDKTDYDFAAEIIDYIYNNYENRQYFFSVVEDTIQVLNQYLQFLLVMREEKIKELYTSDFYPQNDEFIALMVGMINDNNSATQFKQNTEQLIDKFYYQNTDENYDFSAEIISYIYTNYNNESIEFFKFNNNNVEVLNHYIKYLLILRQKKLDKKLDNNYLSNAEFLKIIGDAFMTAENAEDFKSTVENKLK